MTKPRHSELPISGFLDGSNVRVIEVDDEIKELAYSLVANGFIAPVGGVEYPDHVETLFGFRRLTAYRWALGEGLAVPDLVPVLLYPESLPLIERETIQLLENLQRKNLSDVECYRAVKSLAGRGLTYEEIGERINKSKGTVSKWTAPDRCPDEARAAFEAGRLSLGDCYQIVTSPDPLEATRSLLRGETQAAGRRAGRKAAAERLDGPKETVMRVVIPLPPADASGSLGSINITPQKGQTIGLEETIQLLSKALKLAETAFGKGLSIQGAQNTWKAEASAKPSPKRPAKAAAH